LNTDIKTRKKRNALAANLKTAERLVRQQSGWLAPNGTAMSVRCHIGPLRAVVTLSCLILLAARPSCVTAAEKLAAELTQVVEAADLAGGHAAVLGADDLAIASAVADIGPFQVHVLTRKELVMPMRRQAAREGLGHMIAVGECSSQRLPYANNLLNLLIVAQFTKPFGGQVDRSAAEISRVLAPLGVALLCVESRQAGRCKQIAKALRRLGLRPVTGVNLPKRWLAMRKPWPKQIDEWTHYLHGPDGNPVARDTAVGPPARLQWISPPLWLRSHETDSSISTLVTADGRLFYICDEAPIGLAGQHALLDNWHLIARDAFNGKLLWKIPIRRWGWREWKPSWFSPRPGDFPLDIRKRLVATAHRVYVTLGYDAPISELDARTGELIKSYKGTEHASEILYHSGTLVTAVPRADLRLQVLAIDADSGKIKWRSENAYGGTTVDYYRWRSMHGRVARPAKIYPAPNLATDGRVIALIDEGQIVALDFRTGKELWRARFPLDPRDQRAGGISAGGTLWNGTMIVANGVVLHASPYKLAAFDARSGRLLWSQPKSYIGHLWYEWKDVFVIDELVWTWDPELARGTIKPVTGKGRAQRCPAYPTFVNGYDLKTGKLRRRIPLGPVFKTHHHHRCYRNKATVKYILASRRGTEFIDLINGRHTVHNWVRSTCHVGMMPANGLQYVPPHPCRCYIEEKLSGFLALAPGDPPVYPEFEVTNFSDRLERGPAYGTVNKLGRQQAGGTGNAGATDAPSRAADPCVDWPAFRHDNRRSAATRADLSERLETAWTAWIGRVSAPIAARNRVFVAAVDQHAVVCLDAEQGEKLWTFYAGARVDSPPAYYDGLVLFGSADGCVYCLRARDGALVWRFRAAPEQRLIGAFDQLESAWPVHGSVLIQNGTVYFVAGRSTQLDGGLFLFALDARSGRVLHYRHLQGPDYQYDPESGKLVLRGPCRDTVPADAAFDQNYDLPTGSLPDVLAADGNTIFMRSRAFDLELKPRKGRPALLPVYGYLDDTYFKRAPWLVGSEYGRLAAFDGQHRFVVRQFDTLRGLDPTVYFTPGRDGYTLLASNMSGKRSRWLKRVRVRVRAMVITPKRLFVSGPPDLLDPLDPFGPYEGRKGGLLLVFDASNGEQLADYRLPSPPVFNGMAAARGRLFIATQDGQLLCLRQQDAEHQ